MTTKAEYPNPRFPTKGGELGPGLSPLSAVAARRQFQEQAPKLGFWASPFPSSPVAIIFATAFELRQPRSSPHPEPFS